MKRFVQCLIAILCVCTLSKGEASAASWQNVDPALVVGCWGCVEEGDYVLELKDDLSFSGYFDGEAVDGQWQLEAPYQDGKTCTLPLRLDFDTPGDKGSVLALAEGLDPEKNLLQQSYSLVFELSDGHKDLSFSSRGSGYYKAVEEALSISGKWISSNVDYYNWYSGEQYSTPSTDYSVSLGEDNSVHAVLMDGEITGTWELSEVNMDRGYTSFLYDVYSGGSDAAFYFQVLDGAVHIFMGDYSYTMGQMDEAALAEFEKSIEMHGSAPLGQWPSVSVRTTDFSSYIATSTVERSSDYSITFSEDGTVYALLDKEYTGTWEPLRINRHSDDQIQYSYDLHFDGVGEETSIYCYLDAENGSKGELSVSIQTQEPSIETAYYFRQMDEAYLDRLAAMVGYWQPVEAQWYNDTTQELEVQETDENMFFEAFEDGSFRANFPSYFTGTWLYSGLDQHDNATYSISSDDGRSQLYYIFGDTLMGWYENSGKTISVYFEKGATPKGMENNEAAESAKTETKNDEAAAAADSVEAEADLPLGEKLIGSWTAKDALVTMEEVKLSESEYRHFVFNTDGSFEYAENGGKSFCGTWTVSEDNSLADMGIDLAAYGLDDFVSQKVLLTLDDGSTMELSLSEDDGEDRIAPLMLTLTEGDVFTGSFYYFTKD